MKQNTELLQALSEDLLQLGILHDRELDASLIETLKVFQFPTNLGLVLHTQAGKAACLAMQECLLQLPEPLGQIAKDELAADYADIYLNHSFQASPYESVWLDEDKLIHQQPMFELRDIYKQHGLGAENWRQRSDDHLVLQLQFLSVLTAQEINDKTSQEHIFAQCADFLDHHTLLWVPDFCTAVAERCATPFYRALALLTAAYLDIFREHCANIVGQPRPTEEQIEKMKNRLRKASVMVEPPSSFTPGSAPNW